jgi:hypothetical protein
MLDTKNCDKPREFCVIVGLLYSSRSSTLNVDVLPTVPELNPDPTTRLFEAQKTEGCIWIATPLIENKSDDRPVALSAARKIL